MNDWRLTNQMNYLYKATLRHTVFAKTDKSDHEHCEFCFDKFGEEDDLLHSGYCTPDRYRWICEGCFQDFQAMFEWELLKNE